MEAVQIYLYNNCDTCRKAIKWLKANSIRHETFPIREVPPNLNDLHRARLEGYELKELFNRSGLDYRKLGLKDKLPKMTEDEALNLLHKNGNLIKRPFLITPSKILVGFKETHWEKVFHG